MTLLIKIEIKTARTKIVFGLKVKVESPDSIVKIEERIIVFVMNVLSKFSSIKYDKRNTGIEIPIEATM